MAAFSRCLVSILFLIGVAQGRILSLNSSDDQLISDGIDCQDSKLSTCNHQYGFLPCGENAAGYFFLIVVYEVLLVVGGMIIGSGGEVLFYITGERFGGILFRILRALPSMMLMIYSGVFTTKETAQAQVSSVVGIYAGTTVFSLTVQWFMCAVTASKPLKDEDEDESEEETSSSKSCFPIKEKLRTLIDNGVNVDPETSRTAKIMLLSLIPYVVLQLVYVFDNSSGKRFITLISLIVSASSLIGYFAYQIKDPWMQMRSFTAEFVTAVQLEKFISENPDAIFLKYINTTEMYQKAAQQLKDENSNNSSEIDKIMSKLLKHCDGQVLKSEALITDSGEPNIERIRHLFSEYDTNKSGSLSPSEVKLLIGKVKFGTYQMKDEDVVKEIFRVFDKDGNKFLNEREFVKGILGYLEKAMKVVNTPDKTNIVQEFDKIVWKEQVYGKKAQFKSLIQLVVGIAMLTFLAGPLLGNILNLSDTMKAPSFLVSFVVVPLALNGQAAIAALLPASKKTKGTPSLRFSEIYGGVIMNNLSGLTALLAIVYAKGLVWDFSAEVLTIMVVCAIVGAHALCNTTYKSWTSILVFLLYPITLGLFYYFQVVCT